MAATQKYSIRLWVEHGHVQVRPVGGGRFQSKYWEYLAEYDSSGRLVGRAVCPLNAHNTAKDAVDPKVSVPVGRIALDVAEIISQQANHTAYIEAAVREKYQREQTN